MQNNIVVGIDCGEQVTGMAVIVNGAIVEGLILPNGDLFAAVKAIKDTYGSIVVVIEDVRPYGVRLRQELIDTCKFIGEMQYRLREANIEYVLVARATVKAWVFRACYEAVISHVEKNMARREAQKPSEKKRTASFVYVDDRAVIAAMKYCWSITTPKPGKSNQYGLGSHSWQALAVATTWIESKTPDQE